MSVSRSIVLVHGCRQVAELAYGERITADLPSHEFLGDSVREKLIYYPTVTREPFKNTGRITDLIASETSVRGCRPAAARRRADRVMLCGSPAMLRDCRTLLEARGFVEGSTARPATS